MPLVDTPANLLRLGVGKGRAEWSFAWLHGGIGTKTWSLPWNLERATVSLTWQLPWNVIGARAGRSWSLPHWLGTKARAEWELPHHLIRHYAPPYGVKLPKQKSGGSSALFVGASAGDTSVNVASTTGFQIGQTIQIGAATEYRVITGTTGALTFDIPLGGTYPLGTPVATVSGFIEALAVFTKDGTPLGLIEHFEVTAARSQSIGQPGSMTFHVPRVLGNEPNPDVALIADDRLVAIQSPLPMPLWAGTMSQQDSGDGSIQVSCEDLFALAITGPPVIFDEASTYDGLFASSVYQVVINHMNADRGAHQEIQWGLDFSGSKVFHGDFSFEGSAMQAFEMIADRSGTEFAWSAAIGPDGKLQVNLVVRDEFNVPGGAILRDGDGGNIGGIRVTRDPSPIVHRIRLTGQATDIASLVPEWAHWAVHEIEPVIEVEVPAGDHRFRVLDDVTVDWSLSQSAQQALAQRTEDEVWSLYESFIRAVHDIEGRPWHEGWQYAGPPDAYEARTHGKDSMSRRAWRTRLQIGEVGENEPVSGVMISDNTSQLNLREWLIVSYNRVSGEQHVSVRGIPLVSGQSLIKWNSSEPVYRYRVSAGRVVERVLFAGDTGAYVAPYAVNIRGGILGAGYIRLRQIISGPYNLAWWVDPADPDNEFIDEGVDAAIESLQDSATLIGKVYDFEKAAIASWDPRRDGIGELTTVPTIFAGFEATRARWHITSFDVGSAAQTSVISGLSASETTFEVDSVFGFPNEDALPFDIDVDEGTLRETMTVTAMLGAAWTVLRGQKGTTAIPHESGAAVHAAAGAYWDGFIYPWTWPEGQAWAEMLLAKLSQPQYTFNMYLANMVDEWSTVELGSIHDVNINTEGPGVGFHGQARVIGFAPDEQQGSMELVLEWLG